MFLSGLGSSATLGSSGMPTGLALSNLSFFRMDLRYCCYEIVTDWLPSAISIPTIFTGFPKSVSSHSASKFVFVHSISSSIVANNSKLSTQTVTIMNWSPSCRIYVHGSKISCQKPCRQIAWSNSMFHIRPACFRPYMPLMSKQTSLDLSSKLVGCSM